MTKKQDFDYKHYSKGLMQQAKGTIALGTISTLGVGAFSRVGANHPAVSGVTSSAVTGLNLLNVGNVAHIGMNLIPQGKKSKSKDKYLSKF